MNRLLLLLAVTACTPPTPPPDPDGGQAEVLIGTGNASFVPLKDGDEVTIVKGSQGGYHIWGAIRANGVLNPAGLEVHYFILDGATRAEVQGDNAYRLTLVQNGPYFEWYGMIGYLGTSVPSNVQGQPTIMKLTVKDSQGRTASDERSVVPRGP
jgi:hypothetical protein